MLEQNTLRGEWIRYTLTPGIKLHHQPEIRKAEYQAFIAGAASMFRLALENIGGQPTREKQEAAKQALAEELAVLVLETEKPIHQT